jgi:hypothetical protein
LGLGLGFEGEGALWARIGNVCETRLGFCSLPAFYVPLRKLVLLLPCSLLLVLAKTLHAAPPKFL